MTRLEWFEAGHGLTGVRIGAVPPEMLTRYDAYCTYLEFMKAGKRKSEALILTADHYNCDRSTIQRYVYWFERDDVQKAAQDKTRESATLVQ